MALDLESEYPGKVTAADANYPYGSAKNETVVDAFDGTPWEKAILNDILGLEQSLLNAAAIVPSGNADTVVVSQYMQGILYQVMTGGFFEDTGAADAYVLSPLTDNYSPAAYKEGMVIRFVPDNTNTGATTVNVSTLGVVDIVDAQGSALTGGELIASDTVTLQYDAVAGDFIILAATSIPSGRTIQEIHTQDGEVATGTTTIPLDDTIPQDTEGDEYITATITPTNASNKLVIDVVIQLAHSAAGTVLLAGLFQDSIASALAAGWAAKDGATAFGTVTFRHEMVAGTTSATTFKVRAGSDQAGTTTFNGSGGTRAFGGIMASSISIKEVKV